jgi:tRNA1Val (adenine37-N6)-methyltransferase
MKVTTDSCFFGAWVAREMQNEKLKMKNVLDIGAGTGLLSLMIAQKNEIDIDAVEIDESASGQAKENIEASPWKERIWLFNEDILAFQPAKKYDCIISNPPFYENELASEQLKKNIAHHGEKLTISQLLKTIKDHLEADGIFFLMLPFKRKEEVDRLLRKNELYVINSVILSQSVKHAPFRMIIKGATKTTVQVDPIFVSIWDEHQQYTSQFVELLKDYYLYL